MTAYLIKLIVGNMGIDVAVESDVSSPQGVYEEIVKRGGFGGAEGFFRPDAVMVVLPLKAHSSNVVPLKIVGGNDGDAGGKSEEGAKEIP